MCITFLRILYNTHKSIEFSGVASGLIKNLKNFSIQNSVHCTNLPDISLNGRWWNSLSDHTIFSVNLQGNSLVFSVEDDNNCQGIRSNEPNELKSRFFTCFHIYSLGAWRHKLAEVAEMIKHRLQIKQNNDDFVLSSFFCVW